VIIEFTVPERPKRGRASLDILLGLAQIYLEGQGRKSAETGLTSGDDAHIGAACTSIAEGVMRSYLAYKIDRKRVITEYLRLGFIVEAIPWPAIPSRGFQYHGH
jgi:hypothetical protein